MNSQNEAEVVSIGTELLMGETIDTNAAYLASELQLLGIELGRITVVRDDRARLCQALSQSLDRATLVLTSGGLGPTEDDVTRECLAEVLGERLTVDAELEKRLRDLFQRLDREMPASNIRQAMLIPSAQPLPNDQGTAPGWWVEKNGKVLVALPGPPRELKVMWPKEVKPRLRAIFPGRVILTRTLKTFGLSEAKVGEMVKPLSDRDNPSLGIYAKPDGIHLRLIAHGENAGERLQAAEKQIEEIFTGHIWGKEADVPQILIGRWLIEKGLTLATMEDGTHGLLASLITSTDGSAEYYRGGLIACSGEAKLACGLSRVIEQYGSISAETAQAMAATARERFSADLGLSTTGIVGLDSPLGERPGLAYIGFADGQHTTGWKQSNLAYRDDVRSLEAIAGLFRLRQSLIELGIGTQ
jgi:nicotinamide-nucleotide amidase